MKLDLKEAESLLGISAMTIQRWARQGRIPAREADGALVFRQKELERWAWNRQWPLRRDPGMPCLEGSLETECLSDALRRGGVFFNVRGNTVKEVLNEMSGLVPLSADVDREGLVGLLEERERLASTGIGRGVAVPHPREPLTSIGDRAIVTAAFLERPVDFGAMDHVPVFLVLLMLSPATRTHLRLLSRLSFCLRDASLTEGLPNYREEEAFLKDIARAEQGL
ncbi:PTS sugar transporter subunit IIA [Desulfatiglans anilini]|uniref:PTS sugar transporter subunit IIA n=1 Tax=Desulfatiglans anilini TaxID=90728 RepID=UPI0004025E9F|nr:PTS sugar transporter subunit IIA [Desulfatiglans anilini]